MREMPFQTQISKMFRGGHAPEPRYGICVPRLGNQLATPVLIVNTPIVISSKRQVLQHFHMQKYVIFA